jgi:hypothetical protein
MPMRMAMIPPDFVDVDAAGRVKDKEAARTEDVGEHQVHGPLILGHSDRQV